MLRSSPVISQAALAVLAAWFVNQSARAQEAQPLTPADAIVVRLRETNAKISSLAGGRKLSYPGYRIQAGPQLLPLLNAMQTGFDDLITANAASRDDLEPQRLHYRAIAYALDDRSTLAAVLRLAASDKPEEKLRGQMVQLEGDWLKAADAATQSKIVDRLETLAKAHADDIDLTVLTYSFRATAAATDVTDRLTALLRSTFSNPASEQFGQMLAAEEKLKKLENKPMTISGKRVDGSVFTSDDWKGKVVLVDFWATWCPPCVAGLPDVKAAYTQYHDKGFEIVGVSSDQTAEALTTFIAKENMPWPQLFNPEAAATRAWNPITTDLGVIGLPTMFLIDKKGVLRSVTAGDNFQDVIPKLLAE